MLDDAIKKAIGVTKIEKALDSSEIGDFLPIEYATEFVDLVREENYCRGLFPEIVMPSQKFEIPKITGDADVYYVSSEATAPSSQSKPTFGGTGTIELSAKKLMAYLDIANEVEEDSKVAMLPLIKRSFAEGMAVAEEKAMIQGKIVSYGSEDARDAFKGILKIAIDGGATAVDAVTETQDLIKIVEKARYNLGKYGRDTKKLVLVVNPFTGSLLRQLSQVLTLEKYGSGATILSGELGKVMGITIIESAYMPEDATSKATIDTFVASGSATKGEAILMRKDAVLIGDRRKVKFDSDKIVEKDAKRIVISERIDFTAVHATAICQITKLTNSKG